jgi:hypothetical protein
MSSVGPASLWRDQDAAVFAEFAFLLPVIVLIVFGSVDFLYAFYQWNAAAKAVELGVRIAAVSDPVMPGLNQLSSRALQNGAMPGAPMPSFTVTCRDGGCRCTGACPGLLENTFDTAAINRIVFGRAKSACGRPAAGAAAGMCEVLPSIRPENVVVKYQQTGLGYAGRPGGPVPTVEVSLEDMQFHFFFLNSLLGIHIVMPRVSATMTAEDLCSGIGSAGCGS